MLCTSSSLLKPRWKRIIDCLNCSWYYTWLNTTMPSNASRSRRHSQSSSGKSEGRACALPRRATVTSLVPVVHLHRTCSHYRTTNSAAFQSNPLVHLPFQTAPPTQRGTQGILKTHDSCNTTLTPNERRVTFSCIQDGAMNNRMAGNELNASSTDSSSPSPNPGSLTDLMNCPAHSHGDTSSSQHMALSAPFQPNQLVHLPFQTTPPSESHSVKRYGIIEVEQLQDAKTKSFEDVPLALEQRRKSLEAVDSQQPREQHKSYMTNGSRSDYILWDTVRSPSHMIVEDCSEAALHKASQLKLHDFAFIKRSDGSWTYAILACRNTSEVNNEECMMFVMNETGSIKYIKKRKWASFIRCVVVEDIWQSFMTYINIIVYNQTSGLKV